MTKMKKRLVSDILAIITAFTVIGGTIMVLCFIAQGEMNKPSTFTIVGQHDGCTVYLMQPRGVYFTKCDGKAADTQWEERHGRTTETIRNTGDTK